MDLFQDNIGPCLSIDETALSQGELYTVITNKDAKGKKGALVAMIKGTQSETVRAILEKIPLRKRNVVTEVTLDMAATMEKIVRFSFPKASWFTDRFHVQKLAYDAVQEMRSNTDGKRLIKKIKRLNSKEIKQKYVSEVYRKWRYAETTSCTKPIFTVQSPIILDTFSVV